MAENVKIQDRLWHLAVDRLTRNFISAKKETSPQRFGSNPPKT